MQTKHQPPRISAGCGTGAKSWAKWLRPTAKQSLNWLC